MHSLRPCVTNVGLKFRVNGVSEKGISTINPENNPPCLWKPPGRCRDDRNGIWDQMSANLAITDPRSRVRSSCPVANLAPTSKSTQSAPARTLKAKSPGSSPGNATKSSEENSTHLRRNPKRSQSRCDDEPDCLFCLSSLLCVPDLGTSFETFIRRKQRFFSRFVWQALPAASLIADGSAIVRITKSL